MIMRICKREICCVVNSSPVLYLVDGVQPELFPYSDNERSSSLSKMSDWLGWNNTARVEWV